VAKALTARPHLSLGSAVGKCQSLGGAAAFYVCPPDYSIGDPGSDSRVLDWRLTGAAESSNGRTEFSDPNGIAQVVLENGWAFGATGREGGVVVTGPIAPGSIVVIAYAPTPTAVRGYAVWKLTRGTTKIESTVRHGTDAQLMSNGGRLRPTLVIEPSHVIHDPALKQIFMQDMHHLESIADGNVSGACSFYQDEAAGTDDGSCAQAIGLHAQRAAIESSIASARLITYNGYISSQTEINGQGIDLILDHGHFRFPDPNAPG
jgi:hypothetical protein